MYEDYAIREDRLWPEGHEEYKYTPMRHPELPCEIAKLRQGDTKALLHFARRYGLLGYRHVVGCDAGEPLDWIWLHAHTINVCLTLTGLLRQDDETALRRYLSTLRGPLAWGKARFPGQGRREGLFHGELTIQAEDARCLLPGLSLTQNAKWLRRELVNHNTGPMTRLLVDAEMLGRETVNLETGPVTRVLWETEDQEERLYYRTEGVLRAAYWHLGTLLATGVPELVRCKDPKCQAWVAQKDPRQRFCPAPAGVKESRCSARMRMRTRRADQDVQAM